MASDDRVDDVTRLLRQDGRRDELYALVYDELRVLAQGRMADERADHTLQATALVNEVYMRLVRDEKMRWVDRRHFFGAAVEAMRRVLVDHARKVRAAKRGGGHQRLEVTLSGLYDEGDPDLVIALDEGLEKLAEEDARSAEVARLRIYAGLTVDDVALALDLAPRTVQRDWSFARARLAEILDGPATPDR
ncbi:MAG: ECF-type sigma factor [Planctomycetota bacterium]